jgi:TP901 family phage tail tape measure protein
MVGFSGNVRRIATVLTASDRASGDLQRAESAGDDVAESMGAAERRARGLRTGFLAAAGGAAVIAGGLAVLSRQHGQTEQTMARLATVSGATDQEMQKLRDTAMTLGKELPIAMSDAANAMEQLAFAGFEAEEAMNAAAGVADLAVASNMNMAQSARSTASALRMFGLEADQTVQVTSAMAATFSNSATTITELSNALEYVGATATSAGVSLQEISAAVGVLADRGIRASRAGTALNTTLQRIVAGSGQASSALDRLNLSIDDLTNAEGQIGSLGEVLGAIGDRMENLESDAERMQVATELAGRRGARALLPLIESQEDLNEKMGDIFRSEIRSSIGELARLSQEEIGAVQEALGGMEIDREDVTPKDIIRGLEEMHEAGTGVEEMATRLSTALGISQRAATSLAEDVADSSVSADQLAESIGGATTASEIAASQMDTTAGAVKFLKSSFDAMTFTIFTGAAPAIEWFNEKLATGINVLNENEAAMKAVGGALAGLVGVLSLVAVLFGAAYIQASVIPAVMGVVNGSFLAGAASATTLTGALSALLAPLAAVAAPALAIVAAVGLLVGAFFVLRDVIEKDILDVGSDLAVLMERFGAVIDFLKPTIDPLIGILVELGKILLAVAAAPIVLQVMAIIKGLKLLTDVAIWTYEAIAGLINGTMTLEEVMKSAASGIYSFFAGIGDSILSFIAGVDWAEIGMMAMKALALGLVYSIAGIPGVLVALFWDELVAAFQGVDWMNLGVSVIQALMYGMVFAVAGIPGVLIVLFRDEIISALQGLGDYLYDAGVSLLETLVEGIAASPGILKDALWSAFAGMVPLLPASDAAEGPLSRLTDAGKAIPETLAKGIKALPGVLVGAVKAVLFGIPAAIGGAALNIGMSIGKKIGGAIADGLKGMAGAVAGAAKGVGGAAKDAISGAADFATSPEKWQQSGKALVDTVASGAESASGSIKGAVEGAADKASSVLPFSNAEEGPFSNLVERGQALVSTVAKGVEGEDSTLQDTLAGVAEGTPLGQAASTLVGAIGGSGGPAAALGGGPAAGGSGRPIEIVLEQTNQFGDVGDREEIRRMVEEATRSGGENALAELELLLKQTLSEA